MSSLLVSCAPGNSDFDVAACADATAEQLNCIAWRVCGRTGHEQNRPSPAPAPQRQILKTLGTKVTRLHIRRAFFLLVGDDTISTPHITPVRWNAKVSCVYEYYMVVPFVQEDTDTL